MRNEAKQRKATMRKAPMARAIAAALHSPILLVALGAGVAGNAEAWDECGTGAAVVCTPTGNPYANGISYASATDVTLAAGTRVESTTTQDLIQGQGFGLPVQLNGVSGASATATIEAGATVVSAVHFSQGYVAAYLEDIYFVNRGDIAMTGPSSS